MTIEEMMRRAVEALDEQWQDDAQTARDYMNFVRRPTRPKASQPEPDRPTAEKLDAHQAEADAPPSRDQVGDLLIPEPGRSHTHGMIVEIRGGDGAAPYVVQFPDGHTALVFPGPQAAIEPTIPRSGREKFKRYADRFHPIADRASSRDRAPDNSPDSRQRQGATATLDQLASPAGGQPTTEPAAAAGPVAASKWPAFRSATGLGSSLVEVRFAAGQVAVRDSKAPDGPVLVFSQGEWEAFLLGVANGEFDLK